MKAFTKWVLDNMIITRTPRIHLLLAATSMVTAVCAGANPGPITACSFISVAVMFFWLLAVDRAQHTGMYDWITRLDPQAQTEAFSHFPSHISAGEAESQASVERVRSFSTSQGEEVFPSDPFDRLGGSN